jgi:Tol biopolymer transport system component
VAFIDLQNDLAVVDIASGTTTKWSLGPLRLPISVNADGTRIAFVPEQFDAAEEPQVSVLEVTTGALRRVSNAVSDVALPVISAAGTRVVWVEDWVDLKMFDFNTNEIVTIASGFWPTLDYYGTRVAYVSLAGTELRMADTTTAEDRVLLSSDRGFGLLSMSADGKRLVFWSSGDLTGGNADLDTELFILDVTSGVVTQLTSGAGNSALSIAGISAHGSRVAFSDFRPLVGANPEGNFEVFLGACGPAAPPVVYEFGGFEPPLRPDGSASIRQGVGGRTIPVKFSLRLDGQPVTTAVASIALHQVLDAATGTVDVTDLTADAGAANDNGPLFRLDPETLQYVYNLSTANLAPNSTYRIRVTLDDGGVYTVDFSLR